MPSSPLAPGPPEVLHVAELPDREPGPGQVVVAVEVAATTFVETQTRAAWGHAPSTPRRSLWFSATAGALRPTIGQTFHALEQAAAAHAAMEARSTLGRTLLVVSNDELGMRQSSEPLSETR